MKPLPGWTFADTIRHLSQRELTTAEVNELVQAFANRNEELRGQVADAGKRYEAFVVKICAEIVRRRSTSAVK